MIRAAACTLCEAPADWEDVGCTVGGRYVDLDGVEHARWAHLTEPGSVDELDRPCPNCGVAILEFHHFPCPRDRCPHGPAAECGDCRLLLIGELAWEREHAP
jgi:hypothetical protein